MKMFRNVLVPLFLSVWMAQTSALQEEKTQIAADLNDKTPEFQVLKIQPKAVIMDMTSKPQEGITQPGVVTCGQNYFVHMFNGTSLCRPCPPDSNINETQHTLTMCTPVPRVQDNTRYWNFLADEINPYVFLGCIFLALVLILAIACFCWRKVKPKVSLCSNTLSEIVENKRCECQSLQKKPFKEQESKSETLQVKQHIFIHTIKGCFLKFFKGMVNNKDEDKPFINHV